MCLKLSSSIETIAQTERSPLFAPIFSDSLAFAHIHRRKELENYLLESDAAGRALERQLQEHNKRSEDKVQCNEKAQAIFEAVSTPMKHRVYAQFIARRTAYEKSINPGLDGATITQALLDEFEERWATWDMRRDLVPGKEFLSQVNQYLQEHYRITLTPAAIIAAMLPHEVPDDIRRLIDQLERFRKQSP